MCKGHGGGAASHTGGIDTFINYMWLKNVFWAMSDEARDMCRVQSSTMPRNPEESWRAKPSRGECWVGPFVLYAQCPPHHSVIQSGASGTPFSVMHLLIKARQHSHLQDDFVEQDSWLLVSAGLTQGMESLRGTVTTIHGQLLFKTKAFDMVIITQ